MDKKKEDNTNHSYWPLERIMLSDVCINQSDNAEDSQQSDPQQHLDCSII